MQTFHDVSIIIVSIGDTPFLERCVRSCIAQTYPGRSSEVIILHDNKNSIIEDVIANYGRRQVINSQLIDNDPVAILTSAIRNSTGRFLLFVDPNDFISDYMVLIQSIFLYDNASFGGVMVDYWLVEPNGDSKLSRVNALETPILEGIMFRKDILLKLMHSDGPALSFNPKILYDTLSRNTKIGHIPISFYRRSKLSDNVLKDG